MITLGIGVSSSLYLIPQLEIQNYGNFVQGLRFNLNTIGTIIYVILVSHARAIFFKKL